MLAGVKINARPFSLHASPYVRVSTCGMSVCVCAQTQSQIFERILKFSNLTRISWRYEFYLFIYIVRVCKLTVFLFFLSIKARLLVPFFVQTKRIFSFFCEKDFFRFDFQILIKHRVLYSKRNIKFL